MTKYWDGRRRHALTALRLAEAILEVELAELSPDEPERVSIARALKDIGAAALYLEPVEAAPS